MKSQIYIFTCRPSTQNIAQVRGTADAVLRVGTFRRHGSRHVRRNAELRRKMRLVSVASSRDYLSARHIKAALNSIAEAAARTSSLYHT